MKARNSQSSNSGAEDLEVHEHEITNPELEARPVTLRVSIAILSISFLYTISLAVFLLTAPLLSIINQDLGPDPNYTWIASAWTLGTGVGLITTGSLSDILGRRWFMIGFGVLGIIGSIIALVAKNVSTMIASMVFFGLNSGGGLASFASVSELVATKHRGFALGLIEIPTLPFSLCGSLVAHAIATNTRAGWRSIFWLGLSTNIVGTVVVAATYFPAKPLAGANKSKTDILKEFDYIGLFGIVVGPTLFLLGITWVPQYGATSGHFLGPFLAGVLTLIATGIYEALYARNPILHPFLFKRIRTFTMLLVVSFVGGMLFYALQSFWPTFLTLVYDGNDSIQVGIDGVPFSTAATVFGVGSLLLLPILGPMIGTNTIMSVAVLIQAIFIPLMALPGIDQKPMALAFSWFAGSGIGCATLLAVALIQLSTPDEWLGLATGLCGLARSMGGSTGNAIYTTIFQSKAGELVPARVGEAALAAGLPQTSLVDLLEILTGLSTKALADVAGISPSIIEASGLALKEAYRSSFRYVFLTSIPFGVIALACALACKDLSSHMTDKVAQRLVNDTPKDTHQEDGQVNFELEREKTQKETLVEDKDVRPEFH